MLFITLLCSLGYTLAQQQVSRDSEFKGIVGIDALGDTVIFNGLITNHWVNTQRDEIKISQADLNPVDGHIYAKEKESAVVYKKASFSEHFRYVDCCHDAFTFVEDRVDGLPLNVRLLTVDDKVLRALRNFNDIYLSFDVDMKIADIASVGGIVAVLDDSGRVYRMRINGGGVTFTDMTSFFSKHAKKMTSLSVWRERDMFLATSEDGKAWMGNTELTEWESFGHGRSCCISGLFEIPQIESFAEQTFPFCTQTNLQSVDRSTNGYCVPEENPLAFGTTSYTVKHSNMQQQRIPCMDYIDTSVIKMTAQDYVSDYKIVVRAQYDYPAARIGIAFNLKNEEQYDYVYIDPSNVKDCWRMGHMTSEGPVDKILDLGCPGGPPMAGLPFTLEIGTVEQQVIVKLDGFTIFSNYPTYDNMAAGGLLVWSHSADVAKITTFGVGVCYVPKEGAYLDEKELGSINTVIDPTAESPDDLNFGVFTEGYSSAGAGVTESTLTPPYTSPTPFSMGNEIGDFNNVIEDGDMSDASITLLFDGRRYEYYLYKTLTGFSAANRACAAMQMEMLVVEDELQNERVTTLLRQENTQQVWLGKFWLYEWEVTMNDGTILNFKNFEQEPPSSPSGVFATVRADGFWDAVEGRGRYFFICQRVVLIDPNESPGDALDTNRAFGQGENRDDDPVDIAGSVEEAFWHAPVIMRKPVNVTAQVGDTVTFRCTASSKPPPTVIMVKIDDESTELPSVGDPSTLNDESQRVTTIIELESVTMDDAGKYSCIAMNELGTASAPAWLFIEEVDALEVQNTCSMWGDPHIMTYDGLTYNYPGKCTYILSMDCVGSTFWIYGMFKECGGAGINGPSLSALDSITIHARVNDGNHTGVELQRGWVVNIGGAKLRISEGMSARHGNLIIKRTSEHVTVVLPNGIKVRWDGLQMAVIELPVDYPHDRTCGLCGKYNFNPSDDFFMKFGHTDTTDNAIEFGNSWAFQSWFRPCEDVPLDPVDPCTENAHRATEAEQLCYRYIYQVPFSSCHTKVDPTLYYENCKSDWCGSEWRRSQQLPLCNALSAYATACELKGRPIQSWRSSDLCPIDEIKEITKEEGCPWDELEFDFDGEGVGGETDSMDMP